MSIRTKFLFTYISLIAVVIAILNTYPIVNTRSIVQHAKESSLKAGALQIGSSIEALDRITTDTVRQVMGLLETGRFTYIAVRSANMDMLYYQGSRDGGFDESVSTRLMEESLLEVTDKFRSYFRDGAFQSYAAVPIMAGERVIGAVCVYEYDAVEGRTLVSLRNNLRTLSIALGALAVMLSFIYSRNFTKRITRILDAIKNVREGEYTYRIDVLGHDELAQLSDEFNSLTGRLQETEQLRRRFVADASHELKTPLASIRLLSDSIIETPNIDMETTREFVSDIRDESERLSRITSQLLDLTRLDNKTTTVRTGVDCAEVGMSVIRTLRPIAGAAGVELRYDFAKGCQIMATADELFQIIFNLGENAVKYNTEKGSVDIRIFVKEGFVHITVSDTGQGIPAQDLPYIFDRFYRVDKSRDRDGGGSGLGLSIVKSTAERHGGEIQCERNERGGMCFTVRFPVYVSGGKGS